MSAVLDSNDFGLGGHGAERFRIGVADKAFVIVSANRKHFHFGIYRRDFVDQSPGPNASIVLKDQLGTYAPSPPSLPRLNPTVVAPLSQEIPSALASASARSLLTRTVTQPPKNGRMVGAPSPRYGARKKQPERRQPAELRETRSTRPPPTECPPRMIGAAGRVLSRK